MNRECVRGLVCGDEKQGVETVLNGELIASDDAELISAVRVNAVDGLGREVDGLIEIAVFEYDEGSQKFCDACRCVGNVNVLSEENRSGIHVHHDACLCLNSGVSRPVRSGECSDRKDLEGQQKTQDFSYLLFQWNPPVMSCFRKNLRKIPAFYMLFYHNSWE